MASRAFLLLALSATALVSATELKLPTIFSDHMVLQREPFRVRVWGWAGSNEQVTVSLAGSSGSSVADADGNWQVELEPLAAGGPFTLTVAGASTTIKLNDVMVGDVFVCSGQSNMEMTVSTAFNASAEVADANNYPNLRVFTVLRNTSDTPLDDFGSLTPFQWAVSSNTSIGGAQWTYTSASMSTSSDCLTLRFDI